MSERGSIFGALGPMTAEVGIPCSSYWGSGPCRNCGLARTAHPHEIAWDNRGQPACDNYQRGLYGFCTTCALAPETHEQWAWEAQAPDWKPVQLTPGEARHLVYLGRLPAGELGPDHGSAFVRMNRALMSKKLLKFDGTGNGVELTASGRKRVRLIEERGEKVPLAKWRPRRRR